MAFTLRGWRLFGVAGTIFAYVAGILLLSIISLNNPHQRRLRNGHYNSDVSVLWASFYSNAKWHTKKKSFLQFKIYNLFNLCVFWFIHFFDFQSYEVFKHRELGILSRRPPLQWCRENGLRYLTDPEKPSFATKTTTTKAYSSFSGHFLKKYEKYLRKEPAASSVTNLNASYRKSNKDILPDHNQRIFHTDDSFQSQTTNGKNAHGIKHSSDDGTKPVYYEKLWPKTNNLRKKLVKATEIPETGLTALASFPVSSIILRTYFLVVVVIGSFQKWTAIWIKLDLIVPRINDYILVARVRETHG